MSDLYEIMDAILVRLAGPTNPLWAPLQPTALRSMELQGFKGGSKNR